MIADGQLYILYDKFPAIPNMSVIQGAQIDFKTDKYPFCIVWTPIPVLTFFFPFIGHMGKKFHLLYDLTHATTGTFNPQE